MALTREQQAALDELMAHVPREGNGSGAKQPIPHDLLHTWLGVSSGQVKQAVQSLLQRKDAAETQILNWAERNPLDANLEFLSVTSLAFYAAEKDENPKIKTLVDAIYYISTCLSVGYADIFPVTQSGRAIASLVMLVGPAITNMALARGRNSVKETGTFDDQSSKEICDSSH